MRFEMRRRFLEWCRWLQYGAWTVERGIYIDQDGDIDGSGFMFRLEPPGWLRRWARRRLPPPSEDEKAYVRQDISDVLLASLLIKPNLLDAIALRAEEDA